MARGNSWPEYIRDVTERKRFPTANGLVYDDYNFFVIGYPQVPT
jgi:hypothetical protein